MATKKVASTAKKSTVKKSTAKKPTTTKVTTVKAVASTSGSVSKRPALFGLKRSSLVASLVAEFIGTFIFAATVVTGQGQPIPVFFALIGVVLAIGTLSGAYVNPALTIAGWVTRRLNNVRAIGYLVAQVLGAMLALVVLDAFVKGAPAAQTATDMYSSGAAELFKVAALPAGKEWYVFFAEVLGTAVLGFAFAAATRELKERTAGAFTVGLGIFAALMVAGSAAAYVGANAILNPAVAVTLQAINFSSAWPLGVYALGTTLGAVVGFLLYDMLKSAKTES